jgi:hypothetical protein
MSLTRCLKKMGLSSHEAAILKGAAAEYREEGMQARDAAVMAVTDHAEQLLAERADVIAKVLKEAKARGVLADVQAALDAMPQFTRESVGIEEADDASAIDEAAHEAATSPKNDLPQPTDAQKDAGNYRLGHARLIGLDLSIENPAGSKRSGTDANGTAWSVTMRSHYGYIKGTVGKDKDHIDVFVKPGTPEDWTGPVFVIDQTKGNGHFDEHKVMIGFESETEARAAYLANYTKGWDRLRAITETTPAEFKAWLKDGDTTKAFAEPRQGRVGMMLSSGQVVLTSSGRKTTPFPKVKTDTDRKATATVKAVDRWLIDNARDEARARGDDFNATMFGRVSLVSPSQSDKDSAEEYLFGEQPAVVPSILRPLAPAASPELDAALKDAQDALGDLADIFGKNVRSNLTPEQEQKLLPVLTRLFDAAFRAGYYSFRDAARWVLGQIRERIGTEVADALTTEHLQGAYIGMSGRHKATGNVTPAAQVVAIEKESIDAERSGPAVERDREDGDAGDALGAQNVPDDGAGDDGGARAGGRGAASPDAVGGGDLEVSGDEAAAPGMRGDLILSTPEESADASRDFPGSDEPGRGSDLGGLFGTLDPNATAAVDRAATGSADLRGKVEAQKEANKLPVKFNDRANIDATLPFLLEGQREDVAYAEARWAKPEGYGVLFTNGTGTGKTFLALGAVRRMVSAGKGNGIIVVPDQTVLNAWIDSGMKLGLDVRALGSTSDTGKGVAITTYANFGSNLALADRAYDFVVMDEAHNLKVGQQNEDTTYLQTLRAITMHPDGTIARAKMIHRDLYGRLGDVNARLDSLSKMLTDDMVDAQLASHRAQIAKLDAESRELGAEWAKAMGEVTLEVAAAQGEARPRAMFLSATPFAYDKNVDWANGYLFEYGPRETGGYNTPSPFARFMMTHFGYRMRTGKLTSPPKEVNTDLMERTFNSWLRKAGVLSSRTLDVPFDYDRRFVAVESLIGRRIDEAMEWLRTTDDGRLSFLRAQLTEKFDYLSRARLLEALKAAAAVPYIKKHHALGRKVVVWYDFNEGGGFDAFRFYRPPAGTTAKAQAKVDGKWQEVEVDINEAISKFEAQFPDLVALNTNLPSPLQTMMKEFPQAVQNNGVTPKAKRLENIRAFNDDARPDVNIILVQSAANAGWSGHDTTGKHMRVTVNLGLPTQPHKSIQQEGRTYRVGQMSDTSHTYFNTGTTWEVVAFAQKIARRAGTVENLANGEQARGLADAFIQAFEASEEHEPGPGDGKGGKEADRALAKVLDEFDRAVALYYAQEKKNARTKAAEGTDYFATPEPLGLKMVQWADPRPGDSFLEPSAGHGAIARFFPEQSQRVMVEESPKLAARLGLAAEGDIINGRFEDYHIVNKFSVIVMNPPFGVGGKVAVEHIMKAARHLKDGGRIVALLPRGPAADKRLDKFLYEGEEKAIQPLVVHPTLGPIYKGDRISTNLDTDAVVERMLSATDIVAREPRMPSATAHKVANIIKVDPTGDRTTSVATNLHLAADIILPTSAFERAGTSVATHIIILEKQTDPALAQQIQQQNRDYSSAENITEFFERIRDSEIRPRVTPAQTAETPAASAPAADAPAAQTGTLDRGDLPIVEHVTGKGKTLRGIVRADLTQAQAKAIDAFTFKKDGGWFIREKHLKPEEGGGALSRTGQSTPATRFQRASPEDIDAAVADLKRRLPGAPPIFVVKSTNDPRIGRSLARRMTAANAEGAYEQGRVYVVAPEMRSMEHVEGLLAHEVFHAALDLMGEEKSALLRSMQDGNAKLREDAAALRARFPDMGELESVEEVLADYAREGREPTLLQRWANFIRAMLRKIGLARIAKGWTDGEVLGLVADAPRRAFAKRRDAGVRMYVDGRLMRAAPIFYSKMADEIARKGSTGTGAEWKARLAAWVKAGAVKADEVEWSGVTEWLGTREGKVTSEEVLGFLRENGVRVEEVVLGGDEVNDGAVAALRYYLIDHAGLSDFEAGNLAARAARREARAIGEIEGLINNASDYDRLLGAFHSMPPSKYSNYQLPGGTNYREVLLTLPVKSTADPARAEYEAWASRNGLQPNATFTEERYKRETGNDAPAPRTMTAMNADAAQNFRSPHWDDPNILAHIRLNDRTDSEGRRVLFVEEIQSDWAQKGRKEGFGRESMSDDRLRELIEEADGNADTDGVSRADLLTMAAHVGVTGGPIPSAPFVTKTESWTALALKRVIRMAAEEGYDAVAFVTGEQSAERYDLSKQVKSIDYQRNPSDGTFKVLVMGMDGRGAIWSKPRATLQEIEAAVGKEIAEKIERNEGQDLGFREVNYDRRLQGDGLKVGGEGMRAFYDRIVPNVAKDVLKKVGGGAMQRVELFGQNAIEKKAFPNRKYEPDMMQPGFLITPAMRDRAMAGLPLFTRQGDGNEDVYRTVGGGRARPGFPEATRIRGADGRPGTTYRGATRELSGADFALDALGRASGNPSSGLGVWFAADEGIAARYGEVAPFHLDIRNPLVVHPETIPGFDSVEEAHRFRERARKKGHDGIIVDARHLGGPVYYVAFDAEQVVYPRETSGASLSRVNQNLAQPLSEARYTEQDQARAAEVLSRRRGAQALDALVRVPMQALRLDKVTAAVIDGVLEKLGSLASTVAPQAWERAKAGLVDQYGLPQDVKDQRSAMQGRMRAGVRSSKHAIDALANLTRAESRVLYEYVNGDRSRADLLKAGLPEESVRIIDLYQRVADEMGQEAVRLGQLSPDAFEAHRWAYVHRSYQKHVLEMPEQAKVERSRALKVRGDQYKGRGMSQAVPMKAIQNVAPAWWGRKTQDGKADKGLRGESFIRFDRRAAVGEGTADLEGFGPLGRRGRILETHYWPAGEPVPAMYGAWERDAAPWTARDTKGANLLLARDFTQGERQAMGEVDEIRYGMAATLHRMIHDIEVGRMLEYLAVNHGKTDETLPQGANLATDTGRMMSMTRAYTPDEWVLVPESKIPGTSARAYGALAGMYVPGPIWNDVRQIVNTNIYPLGQTYADLLRAWKLSKTALSLPVHMNNVMSNVLMADFHDVTAKDVLAALEVMRHRDRPENSLVLERFEDAGGSEGLYNLTELQKETIQPLIDQLRAEVDAIDPAQGLTRVSSIVTLITQMRFREAFALAAQSKAGKSGAFVRDKLVKAYENEDLVFRLAAFIRAKGDGSSDVEAGRQARQSFLDYQINAPWVNLMRSTAFPFISFTYRALPMMLHTAKTKPWKVVKWGGIMGLLNLIGYAVSGGDEDKERRLLPEEVAGRTILGSPKLLRAPWNDEHGSPVFLDVRRWIPVGDIVDWGQTHSVVPFFPQLMPSGPAGLFAELALNKSAFTGKEITQETDTAAEMAGKVADYLYKAFAPNTPGVPFAYSTEKIMQAGGGKTDAFGREQSVAQAAASSVGVKLAAYPTDVLQRNAVIQFRARDAEIKANVARLGRELQRKGIDPEEYEAKLQRQVQKRIDLQQEMAKKMGQGE